MPMAQIIFSLNFDSSAGECSKKCILYPEDVADMELEIVYFFANDPPRLNKVQQQAPSVRMDTWVVRGVKL